MGVTYFVYNREPNTSIVMTVSHKNSIHLKFATGFVIPKKYWLQDKKQVSRTGDPKNLINGKLRELKKNIEEFIFDNQLTITKENLTSYIKALLGNKKYIEEKESYLISFFIKDMIRKRENKLEINENTGKYFSENTIKAYKQIQNYWEGFEVSLNLNFTVFQIDKTVLQQFKVYLFNLGLQPNTVTTNMKNIKVVLRWIEKTKNIQIANDISNFKNSYIQVDNIALSEIEINKIQALELDDLFMEKIRDLFIFQCYTGLRYSDLKKLRKDNFDLEKNNIKTSTQKTNQNIIIPLLQVTMDIAKKYNYNLPEFHISYYNKVIKILGKLALIKNIIEIKLIENNQQIIKRYEKWKLFSSHTARRTFITLCIEKGIPSKIIMSATGHKNLSIFETYFKQEKEESADIIRKYFN